MTYDNASVISAFVDERSIGFPCCAISMASTLTPGEFGMKDYGPGHFWLWYSASGPCLDFRRWPYSRQVGASRIQNRADWKEVLDEVAVAISAKSEARYLAGCNANLPDLTVAIDVNESLSKLATTCARMALWIAIQLSWAVAWTRMAQYRNGPLSLDQSADQIAVPNRYRAIIDGVVRPCCQASAIT